MQRGPFSIVTVRLPECNCFSTGIVVLVLIPLSLLNLNQNFCGGVATSGGTLNP